MKRAKVTRQKLYDLAWSKPLTAIAKEYNLTYSHIIRIYKKNNIPFPDSGHWMKLKFNKKVNIKPLPKIADSTDISLNKSENKESINLKTLSEKQLLKKEIEKELKVFLIVPKKLTKPNKYIIDAKNDLKNKKPSHYHNYKGLIFTSQNVFDIIVFKNTIRRALVFSDTLIKLFLARGHIIETGRNESRVVIYGESFEINVRETRKRVKNTEDRWGFTEFQPTGILTVRIKKSWHNYEWKDSKTIPLENKLSQILTYLELRAKKDIGDRIEREKLQEIADKKRKIEQESRLRREKELEEFKFLLQKSARWKKAVDLRNYIEAIEMSAKKNNSITSELKSWLIWANKKVDWYDPLIEKEDELLDDVNRETLEATEKYYWS